MSIREQGTRRQTVEVFRTKDSARHYEALATLLANKNAPIVPIGQEYGEPVVEYALLVAPEDADRARALLAKEKA